MKLLLLLTVLVAGCASAGPLDLLTPTKRPSGAYREYMGHLYTTNTANGVYHSLVDTTFEKNMVNVRKMELEGLRFAAKGETELIEGIGKMMSNGAWAGLSALLIAGGIALPAPGTKAKIQEAGQTDPNEFIKGD